MLSEKKMGDLGIHDMMELAQFMVLSDLVKEEVAQKPEVIEKILELPEEEAGLFLQERVITVMLTDTRITENAVKDLKWRCPETLMDLVIKTAQEFIEATPKRKRSPEFLAAMKQHNISE